jgi:sec-independent protein translocase protein TatA
MDMGLSLPHILLVVLLLVLLFGRGKISDLMGDMAKGIKSFKSGLADDSDEKEKQAIEHQEAQKPVPHEATQEKATATKQ